MPLRMGKEWLGVDIAVSEIRRVRCPVTMLCMQHAKKEINNAKSPPKGIEISRCESLHQIGHITAYMAPEQNTKS